MRGIAARMAETLFGPILDTASHLGGSAARGRTQAALQESSVNHLDVSGVDFTFQIGVQMLPSVTKAKYIRDYLV
jgi:hypothetical protein